MKELRRWEEDGATRAEIELLQAARSERPPVSGRARVLGGLGVGVTVLASTSAATATATASTATGGLALATKIIGISLLVGGTTAGGLALHVSHASSAGTRPTAPVAGGALARKPVATVVATPEVVPLTVAEPAVRLPEREGTHAPPSPPRRAQPPGRTLSLEVAALERAKTALGAGDTDAALRALDRYRAQFSRGELSSEETVLRVEALLAKGESTEARALAADYSAAHPESPYARRIRDLVGGAAQE